MGVWDRISLLVLLVSLSASPALTCGSKEEGDMPNFSITTPTQKYLRGGGGGEAFGTSQRVLQELREYAEMTGQLDQGQSQAPVEGAPIVPPHYQALHPSQNANMGPEFDSLANVQGTGGMGPGAVVMGVVAEPGV